MSEFLVELVTTVPEGADRHETASRRAAERARVAELAAAGNLLRLWRPVGEMRTIGIWRAADEDELRSKVLATLPLRPWMTVHVTPLTSHPNDPAIDLADDPAHPGRG